MNNLLVGIAGLICTILVAAIFAPVLIDWNSYKNQIETFGQKLTGQNFQIIGDVKLRLLPQPVFSTGGLVITNDQDKKLLETNDFTLELDFPSLLRGKIEVTSMHLNDGKIFVAKAAQSEFNLFDFDFGVGKPIGLDDISIKKLILNNMDVEFVNEVTNSKKIISINQAAITARSLRGPYKITGSLNVDANDVIYQRPFLLSTGKYTPKKPLTVKLQINGEKKRSYFRFIGNLVGIEENPLLIGKLSVIGKMGEDLIGYGHEFGSKLSDEISLESDISISYSAMKLSDMKMSMGISEGGNLADGIKLNGEILYNWGHKPNLDGFINIGVADYDFIKLRFLNDDQLSADLPIYQSMAQLSDVVRNWISEHVIINRKNGVNFKGNISLNIDQIAFLQNNVIDRVRLIRMLINIDKGKMTVPEFSARFPGNSRLKYSLSRQAIGASEDLIMTGQFEFNALHLAKFNNWLLFQNKQVTDSLNDFWGLNDQFRSRGHIDVAKDGIRIISSNVKTKYHQYALDYRLENKVHNFDISFDKVSFGNDDITKFRKYITPFFENVFSDKSKIEPIYHLLSTDILKNIGEIKLSIHGGQTHYGIHDVGVFDTTLSFTEQTTKVEKLSVIGKDLNISMSAELPNIYRAKNIIDVNKNDPFLEFSITDPEMSYTSQLFHNLLIDNNLFIDKLIPKKGSLKLNGQMTVINDNADIFLDIAGRVDTSDIDISADIIFNGGEFEQKNIQFQINNLDSSKLLNQYNLMALIGKKTGDLDVLADGVVKLSIMQNDQNERMQDVKFLALAGDQDIELSATVLRGETIDLTGDLHFNISDLGVMVEQLNILNGDFNKVNFLANFDGKIAISDDYLKITSENIRIINSEFQKFTAEVDAKKKIKFFGETAQLNLRDLLSLFAGINNGNYADVDVDALLGSDAKDILATARGVFDDNQGNVKGGFYLRLLENVDFDGTIKAQKLELTDQLSLTDAEISIRSLLNQNVMVIKVKGDFYNSKLDFEFLLKSDDYQLYIDASMRVLALDIEQIAAALNLKNLHLKGLVDIDVDIAGQGYGVDGLFSNLSGVIDVDFSNLRTFNINNIYFNEHIVNATDEAKITNVFTKFINLSNLDIITKQIKILPEKLVINLVNGLATINQEISFQKYDRKPQKGRLIGQIDLSNDQINFTLQIPLADEDAAPRLRLDLQSIDGKTTEVVNSDDLQEYYRVKLLEKNVQRLEELQREIKLKNDAEIARYEQEKSEAKNFRKEIKVRVAKAISARKLREIAENRPHIPKVMPYLFVSGTTMLSINELPPENAKSTVEVNSLTPVDLSILFEETNEINPLLNELKSTDQSNTVILQPSDENSATVIEDRPGNTQEEVTITPLGSLGSDIAGLDNNTDDLVIQTLEDSLLVSPIAPSDEALITDDDLTGQVDLSEELNTSNRDDKSFEDKMHNLFNELNVENKDIFSIEPAPINK